MSCAGGCAVSTWFHCVWCIRVCCTCDVKCGVSGLSTYGMIVEVVCLYMGYLYDDVHCVYI